MPGKSRRASKHSRIRSAGNKSSDDKKAAANATRENLKDLRSALADEHTMHRAKSVACLRSFDPSGEKAFDKKPHLKALRAEHDDYDAKTIKALDEFEEKCVKGVQGGPGDTNEGVEWITGKMEDSQKIHKKAVVKIAKAMCKAASGEEDQADEEDARNPQGISRSAHRRADSSGHNRQDRRAHVRAIESEAGRGP